MKSNRLYIVIGILLVFSSEFAAFTQVNADSLRQRIAVLPDGPEKAESLIHFAKSYSKAETDTALYYLKLAREMAAKHGSGKLVFDADFLLGKAFCMRSDYGEALSHFDKAAMLADELNDNLMIARSRYNMGLTLTELGDFEEAINNHRSSLNAYMALMDSKGILANYNAIGSTYTRKAQYDSAAYYLHQAVITGEAAGMEIYLMTIYNSLAEVLLEIDQYEDARDYVMHSIKLSESYDNVPSAALSYNILGRIYNEMENYPRALENYETSAGLYQEINDSLHLYDIYNNIGVVYREQGNLKAARTYFDSALQGYRSLNYKRGIVIALKNKGAVLTLQGKYEEARVFYDTVIRLAVAQGFNDHRLGALWYIAENYEKSGNYRKAFEFQRDYIDLKDSIFSIEKEQAINNLVLKYEKKKDQARILALENENLEKDLAIKKQTLLRNAYLYTGISILALAVFVFLFIHQRRKKDKIIAVQKIRQLEEEKKLIAAKLLVEGQEEERKRIATELHDGLGVLLSATKMQFSTIMDKSPENRELIEKASRLLEQATGDVRKISHNMMPGLLTKLGFFDAVEDFIEHIDETEGLNASCETIGEPMRLPENNEIMLYRIVQELVNNTLKHAQASNIRLKFQILPEILDIVYADDGIGFDFNEKLNAETMGLKSIKSRVDFLNGKMDIDSKPGEGVKYSLQIPIF
jgi:signal transduction histidine kinase/Flp pilus assembly protein TadD